MFTAKYFLKSAPSPTKYQKLSAQIKADPERLRVEFMAIAIDRDERFDLRATSLTVLSRHSDELRAGESSQVIDGMIGAFEKEFPAETLNRIATMTAVDECGPEAYLAHLFCIVFAKIAPEVTERYISEVQTALSGTSLGPVLALHLATIKGKRGS